MSIPLLPQSAWDMPSIKLLCIKLGYPRSFNDMSKCSLQYIKRADIDSDVQAALPEDWRTPQTRVKYQTMATDFLKCYGQKFWGTTSTEGLLSCTGDREKLIGLLTQLMWKQGQNRRQYQRTQMRSRSRKAIYTSTEGDEVGTQHQQSTDSDSKPGSTAEELISSENPGALASKNQSEVRVERRSCFRSLLMFRANLETSLASPGHTSDLLLRNARYASSAADQPHGTQSQHKSAAVLSQGAPGRPTALNASATHHPKPRLSLDKPGPAFRYHNDFLKQKHFVGCNCKYPCIPGVCTCIEDYTTCRESCSCGHECDRQFPGCDCPGSCENNCPCVVKRRECGPRCKCKCDECKNRYSWQKIPPLAIRSSKIPNAGKGLFALEWISKGAYLGSYDGEAQEHDIGDKTPDGLSMFQIASGTSINGARGTSATYYINHSNRVKDRNVEFKYIETASKRSIMAFATRDIDKEEELITTYDRRYVWVFPKSPIDTDEVIFHHGEVIRLGSYIFVRTDSPDEDRYPSIAKVIAILPQDRLKIVWMYHPAHVSGAKETCPGRWQILYSNHVDTIEAQSVTDLAAVEEYCDDAHYEKNWHWNRVYEYDTGELKSPDGLEGR